MMQTHPNTEGWVSFERSATIGILTFFHPAHNSLPGKLLSGLAEQIALAGADPLVKVILLKSAGEKTFCAGASFDELMAIADPDQGLEFFMGFARVINALRQCPKLVIGRIQGKAVGGGVGLAAATDFCVATQAASIKLSELAVGIGPFVVGPAVERKMGKAATLQLAIQAEAWQSAQWAQQHGLFQEVFEDTPSMDAWLEGYLARLSDYSAAAMQALKAAFWEGTEHWDELLAQRAAISGRLILTPEAKNALAAIKQKNR